MNSIHTHVPESGSTEDIILQQCELKVRHDHPSYPRHTMHVYAYNDHCDQWNDIMLQSLPGPITTNIARNTKKDNFTQIADVEMPKKPHETGNLRKVLQLKVGAKIRLTTNIDVSDGLTNGAMGSVSHIIDKHKQKIQALLVQFDNETIGEDAKKNKYVQTHKQKCSSNRRNTSIISCQRCFIISCYKEIISTKFSMGSYNS